MKNRAYLCLIFLLVLTLFGCKQQKTEQEEPTLTPVVSHLNDYSLKNVNLMGQGDFTNDYKISFFPSAKTEGVTAYMIGFSVKNVFEVKAFLKTLTKDELFDLDRPVNRAYVITNLNYADGVGNTLNSNQKDLMTGQDFTEPGTYYFYAITLGESGFLGIEVANRTVIKSPYAKDLLFTIRDTIIEGTYMSYQDVGIEGNVIFYRTFGYTKTYEDFKNRTKADLETLVANQQAVYYENQELGSFSFDLTVIRDVDGNPYDETKMYYVYLASTNSEKVLGLSYNDGVFITPKVMPNPLDIIGKGPGYGTIFPNGGAATIDGSRNSIISSSQSIFRDIASRPRIAIVGASSGNEALNSHYFHFNVGSSLSDLNRFSHAGFEAVYLPLTIDNHYTVGESEYFSRLIESCHGVYFLGGDQFLAVRALTRDDGNLNKIGMAIRNVFLKGGVLMGSSAGAHVLGDDSFQGGSSSYQTLYYNQTEYVNIAQFQGSPNPEKTGNSQYYPSLNVANLAIGHKTIFDSHFDARGRLGRLIVAARDTGSRFGIGLDEATGIIIRDGIGTVVGFGGVYIIDMEHAVFDQTPHFKAENITVHYLTSGDSFDFKSNTYLPIASKYPLTMDHDFFREPYESLGDFFQRNYMTTRSLFSFVLSNDLVHEFQARSTLSNAFPSFRVTVSKTEETTIYVSDRKYTSINELIEYPIMGYSHMNIRIEINQ